ncbi:hypothetical protein N1851_017976 [Merluccius polli]|uniref:Uncharacterized protein n=1 Tax=Merluccius polli TaxID=89951 RepID=A0AA47MP04_MERPO|nr:hypothetical protein N1851_017976 [Merluccius polli]
MERLSGSTKRKIKKEKLVRNAENLKYIPKIGTFFNAITITKAASVEEEASNSPPPAESAPRSLDTETPLAASSSSDDSPVAVPASTASATTTEGNNNDDGPSVSPPLSVGTTSTPKLPGDPALWPPITEQLREEALYRGPAAFHNRASKYPASCEAEQHYWKVLRCVVAVITFLGARGLPFRGDNELLGSAHNGNYLGLLELIAEFDPFFETAPGEIWQ